MRKMNQAADQNIWRRTCFTSGRERVPGSPFAWKDMAKRVADLLVDVLVGTGITGDPKNAHLSMVHFGVRYVLPSTSGGLLRVPHPD